MWSLIGQYLFTLKRCPAIIVCFERTGVTLTFKPMICRDLWIWLAFSGQALPGRHVGIDSFDVHGWGWLPEPLHCALLRWTRKIHAVADTETLQKTFHWLSLTCLSLCVWHFDQLNRAQIVYGCYLYAECNVLDWESGQFDISQRWVLWLLIDVIPLPCLGDLYQRFPDVLRGSR